MVLVDGRVLARGMIFEILVRVLDLPVGSYGTVVIYGRILAIIYPTLKKVPIDSTKGKLRAFP